MALATNWIPRLVSALFPGEPAEFCPDQARRGFPAFSPLSALAGVAQKSEIRVVLREEELSVRRTMSGMMQGALTGGLGMLTYMALARVMSVEGFGEFSAARGVLSITTIIAALGLGPLATSLYRSESAQEDGRHARGIRRAGPLLILLCSALTYALLVGVHGHLDHKTAVRLVIFAAVLGMLPLYALSSFFSMCGAAHGAAVLSNAFYGWGAQVLLLLLIGIAVLAWGSSLSVLTVVALYACSAAGALMGTWFVLARVEPTYLQSGSRHYDVRGWLQSGISFALASIALSILDSGGVVVLGWVHANAKAAAHLSAASKVGWLIFVMGASLRMIFRPVLVEAIDARNPTALRRVFRLWFSRIVPVTLPLALGIIVAGSPILKLYGADFVIAYWTLVVYTASYFLGALALPLLPLYQYLGHGKSAVRILFSAAALGIAGMIGLGFLWHDTGVALASALAVNGATALIGWRAWREVRSWDREQA